MSSFMSKLCASDTVTGHNVSVNNADQLSLSSPLSCICGMKQESLVGDRQNTDDPDVKYPLQFLACIVRNAHDALNQQEENARLVIVNPVQVFPVSYDWSFSLNLNSDSLP